MLRKVCLHVETFKVNFLSLFFLTAKQLLKKPKKRKIKIKENSVLREIDFQVSIQSSPVQSSPVQFSSVQFSSVQFSSVHELTKSKIVEEFINVVCCVGKVEIQIEI